MNSIYSPLLSQFIEESKPANITLDYELLKSHFQQKDYQIDKDPTRKYELILTPWGSRYFAIRPRILIGYKPADIEGVNIAILPLTITWITTLQTSKIVFYPHIQTDPQLNLFLERRLLSILITIDPHISETSILCSERLLTWGVNSAVNVPVFLACFHSELNSFLIPKILETGFCSP